MANAQDKRLDSHEHRELEFILKGWFVWSDAARASLFIAIKAYRPQIR